jgi:hypothetical protein
MNLQREDTTRNPHTIEDGGTYYTREDIEKALLTAMCCLCHDSAVEEPNEAMKSSQAALNLAHALSTLRIAYRERQ